MPSGTSLRVVAKFAALLSPCSSRGISSSSSGCFIQLTLSEIVKSQNRFGFHDGHFKAVIPNKIVVEYSSPNIAKKFHAGHFRSTIVGQTVGNILDAVGHEVTRINYLGDWGMQFSLLLLGFERYGDKRLLRNAPLKHLLQVYIKANEQIGKDPVMKAEARELFCKMEQGDENVLGFWKLCCDVSLEEYKRLYGKMNVVFDIYESESMYQKSAGELVISMRQNRQLMKLADGAEGMDIRPASWHKPAMNYMPIVVRSNGTSLYLTRDLATAISRYEKYDFHRMIYVTDKAQVEHFLQVFCILELLGHKWAEKASGALQHIPFGRVIGMKTRAGDATFLEDILEEAFRRTRDERLQHSTRKADISDEAGVLHNLALSGLICNDLKPKLSTDIRFSWSSALQSKGDTGLFLQYTHSRLQSLKRSCGLGVNVNADCSNLVKEQAAVDLVIHLSKLNDVAWQVYCELEPSHLVKYMFRLSHLIAKAHKQLNVKGQDAEIAQPRLLLFHCAQIVLNNCMRIVNIEPLDKM